MLVDGGPPDTWPILEARLKRLDPDDRHIDVAVVTHIDSDHIGGMIPFLECDFADHVGDYWFNGRTHLPEVSATRSVGQGVSAVAALLGQSSAECCRGTGRSAAVRSTLGRRPASSRFRSRTSPG
jgi:hypothetical protein